ncbi:ABC transporter ATP-binding protein [Anaerophaga thermohalophila]|uniref:ABC transporter ATP-binding protein n=1 Tax=Anaerophaga thermohalophila TaxID=177400 RepID=UPI00031145CA|nr:ABC transporter ATP-binding protein [Anaerophaga thermohalophila]
MRYIWKSSPGWTLFNGILLLVRGILPLLLLYLVKLLVDEIQIVAANPGGEEALNRLISLLIIAAAVFLTNALSASLGTLVRERQSFVISDYFDHLIHNKTTRIEYGFFEHPKYQNVFFRALHEASHRPSRIFYGIVGILQNLITLIVMGGILLMVHWSVSIVLLLVTLPVTIIRLRYARELFRFKRENTDRERKVNYYNRLLTSREFAKELRTFDLGRLFRKRYHELKNDWRQSQYKMLRSKTTREVAVQILAAIAVFSVYGLIAYRAFQGDISIGSVVLYFMALQRGYAYLQQFLGGISGLYEDSLFLNNLFEFLHLPESRSSTKSTERYPFPARMKEGIRFDNVGFHYPVNNRWVLRNVTFNIDAGETVALVGVNGAGKTTLVKLLCGLYKPVEGAIFVDGIPLDEIRWKDRIDNISVIYQDFMLYNVTARENIWFGNIRREPADKNIKDAAAQAGIDEIIENFEKGYETTLGTLFEDSEQLSPGQWQRLALARSFFNPSQIVLLDEPTSALDAFSEARLLQYIKGITENRTAMIISHRLSTIKMADRIVVLDGQHVVETGHYDELMNKKGAFYQMVESLGQYGV